MQNRLKNWRSATVVGLSLLVGVGLSGIKPHGALAKPPGYTFTSIVFLGAPAPGAQGGILINDFEPGAINNRGDVIFGADLGTSTDPASFFGEGVFLRHAGQISALGSDAFLLGQTALNDQGDAAFAFFGANTSVYRYSHITGNVTSVVVPGVTPAPAGGTFAGLGQNTSLNDRGDLVFAGTVATGVGIFKADRKNRITSVVSPGDAAPGGGAFDAAGGRAFWVNQAGDVAFTAHVAGQEADISNLYVKHAGTGTIRSIAHAGDPAPRGGVFRSAYSPVLNDAGDIVFLGDLSSPPDFFQALGVYLYSGGTTLAVARPGDPMPGGGKFVRASFFTAEQVHVNNASEVAFNALLDTVNGDGTPDTGLYVWSHSSLRVVARTGTVIPGVGTVSQLAMIVLTGGPPAIDFLPDSGASNNDHGQVLFGATLTDGRSVLLLATPKP